MTGDLFDLPGTKAAGQTAAPVRLGAGAVILPGLAASRSARLLEAVRGIVRRAPLRHYDTPGGRRMSVAMTACGDLGWVSDRSGYRYTASQPDGKGPWPQIPDMFAELVREVTARAGFDHAPLETGLVNVYRPGTRLSLHQDLEKDAPDCPIVSVSFGVAATFLWGGATRAAPVQRFRLCHGDVVVWGGPERFAFHGVAPLTRATHPETGDCRVNLTFRRVSPVPG
jgi:alkylated DNA repair protein (DNA oxidative demethylase)